MRRVKRSDDLIAFQLHHAVASSDAAALHTLLQEGLDPERVDEFGNCPLHRAACKSDLMCVRLLLDHGADANAKRKDGKLPFDLVEWRLLGAKGNPPDGLACQPLEGDPQRVAALLSEKTGGYDVVGSLKIDPLDAHTVEVSCISLYGSSLVSLTVDPREWSLQRTQEAFAQKLGVSEWRLRLILPECNLSMEKESHLLLSNLLEQMNVSYRIVDKASNILGLETTPKSQPLTGGKYLPFNELSLSSLMTDVPSDSEVDDSLEHPALLSEPLPYIGRLKP